MTDEPSREDIKARAAARALDETYQWRSGYESGYRTGWNDARARYHTCDHCIGDECHGELAPGGYCSDCGLTNPEEV